MESIISLNFMLISIFSVNIKLLDSKALLFSSYKCQLFILKSFEFFRPTFIRLFSVHKEKNFSVLKVAIILLESFKIAWGFHCGFLMLPTNILKE